MTLKRVSWLIVGVVAFAAVKVTFAMDAEQRNALFDAFAAPLNKFTTTVAEKSGLDDSSKNIFTTLVKASIANQEAESWCLNSLKMKSPKTNRPIGLEALGNMVKSQGQTAGTFPATVFPLIFAEEAFIKWNDHDVYVMEMLIGGGYIAVHEGGYKDNPASPGQPGRIDVPTTDDQVDIIVEMIRQNGAVVDLTDKGRNDGVWDPGNGLCLQGHWELNEVTGWTDPAPDKDGKIVTHIRATEIFQPTSLGAATSAFNPMGFSYTTAEQEFVAAKFNDGWRIVSGE